MPWATNISREAASCARRWTGLRDERGTTWCTGAFLQPKAIGPEQPLSGDVCRDTGMHTSPQVDVGCTDSSAPTSTAGRRHA